jgi:hypothetical protein
VACLPLKIGLHKFIEDLGGDGLLYLAVGLLALSALALRLAFPPRSTQPKLQISHDNISFVPGPIARHVFAEPTIEAEVPSQAREILVCHHFLEELPDGYSLIIRLREGMERGLKVGYLRLDTEELNTLSEGIRATIGLPVQFVVRRRLPGGSVQETQWVRPAARTHVMSGFVAIAITALPYIGGITVGYLLPHGAIIVAVGLSLWLCQILAAYVLARRQQPKSRYPMLYSFTTLFTFGAAYGIAVAIVAFTFHSR